MYTLLIGKPPFETSCLKDTYAKIKKNEYTIPPNKVSSPAKNLINHLLQSDPSLRPTMAQILQDEFFYCGYLPPRLPTTCLSMPPRFDRDIPNQLAPNPSHTIGSNLPNCLSNNNINSGNGSNPITSVASSLRRPLLEINDGKSTQITSQGTIDTLTISNNRCANPIESRSSGAVSAIPQIQQSSSNHQLAPTTGSRSNRLGDNAEQANDRHDEAPDDYFLNDLYQQLNQVILAKPTEIEPLKIDDAEDPACVPMLWISKWVDYSDKYGLGYQLCDDSVGVLFNDSTRLILCSSGE